LALSFARIFYRNAVDGAFLLPIEIEEDAYKDISDGDELEINTEKIEIKIITKNQTYSMKPFSEIISKIIAAGGIFKYKP
jgi:3-isopropylmalate/(R)-2-methylmalate dehydratase small subunit